MRPFVFAMALGLLLALPGFSVAQEAQEGEPTATHARRGMIIGGVTGGVLGGLGLGVLANGLCEYECDNAFAEGLVLGFLGGGILGGLTGLVIGAGIPKDGGKPASGPSEPWALGVGLGPRLAGSGSVVGSGVWMGLLALRPTTSRIRWGVQLDYLGKGTSVEEFEILGREGESLILRNKRKRSLWNLSLVAERAFEGGKGSFVSAAVGIYPQAETLRATRTATAPGPGVPSDLSESDFSLFPGLGLGAGGLRSLGERAALGFDSRLHLILGAGSGSILPIFTAGLTLRRLGAGGG